MTDAALELREHVWTECVALAPEEAAAIACSDAGIEVRPTTRTGIFDLRASSVVGTLVLPTRPVVIRPKVPVDRLLWMLDVVGRVPTLGPEAPFDEDVDLLSSLQEQYARLLARALRLGSVREYVPIAEDLRVLRGAPDLVHLKVRRFGLFPPIRCRFDEFSVDTEVNRILLAAARTLSRWRRSGAGRRLDALARDLEGVRGVRYAPERVPEPRLDRRYAHVVPALRMAQLVLRRSSFEFRNGQVRAMSFLVDMNRLYEEFVVEGLRRALGLSAEELVAHPADLHLDVGRSFRLVPDGLWRSRDGRPLLVLDAKYKQGGGAVREDVYQLVAYGAALGLERGVLVYADVPSREYELVHGPRLLTVRLGLEGPVEAISARVAEVATRIAAFAGVQVPRIRPDVLLGGGSAELVRQAVA